MADTTTTTYGLTKPEVGASEDTWGTKINDNLDDIDDLLDGTTPVTGIDINSGTIDNAVIGDTTPAAATVTTFTSTGIDDNATSTQLTISDSASTFVGDVTISKTTPNLLIEGTGITKAGLQIKSNGTVRWDINAPSGSANLVFNNLTVDALTLAATTGDATFAGNINAVAGGINLGATGAANLLDDYEEGTFTPTIAGSTIAGTFTKTQTGEYTKIGNLVRYNLEITVTATSVTPTGSVQIGGLPFTPIAKSPMAVVNIASGITSPANTLNIIYPAVATTNSVSYERTGGLGNIALNCTALGPAFKIRITGTFEV